MKMITVRELRTSPSKVWKYLKQESDLVLTNNGKPVAILTAADEESLEERLEQVRAARALRALERIQRASVESGRSAMTDREIQGEIRKVRRSLRG